MATPTPNDGFTPVTLVYAGERQGQNTPRVVAYHVLTGKTLGERLVFKWTRKSGSRVIGGIYSGCTYNGKQIRGLDSPLKYEGKIEARGQIVTWEAEEAQARTTIEETKLEKEDGRYSEIERIMLPLRKEYARHAFDPYKKQALKTAVIAALITPPRQSEL